MVKPRYVCDPAERRLRSVRFDDCGVCALKCAAEWLGVKKGARLSQPGTR